MNIAMKSVKLKIAIDYVERGTPELLAIHHIAGDREIVLKRLVLKSRSEVDHCLQLKHGLGRSLHFAALPRLFRGHQ